jgi:hypothetical protein
MADMSTPQVSIFGFADAALVSVPAGELATAGAVETASAITAEQTKRWRFILISPSDLAAT